LLLLTLDPFFIKNSAIRSRFGNDERAQIC